MSNAKFLVLSWQISCLKKLYKSPLLLIFIHKIKAVAYGHDLYKKSFISSKLSFFRCCFAVVLENVPFIYRLKLYELFRNGKNETALYRLICYIEVSFKAGVTICKMTRWIIIWCFGNVFFLRSIIWLYLSVNSRPTIALEGFVD
jgi:hypothetical protein